MTDPAPSSRAEPDRAAAPPVQFPARLLVETARAYEAIAPEPLDDRAAVTGAVAAGGDFEQRLVTRAQSLPVAARLTGAVGHVRRALALIVLAAVLIGLLAGAATARAALGGVADAPVNFYLVFGSVLGVQSILLVAWVIIMLAGPRALGAGSLGGVALAVTRWIVGRVHRDPAHLAAAGAVGGVLTRGPIGRWTLSSISHGIWLAFNVGALVTIIWLLSVRDIRFCWETTILDEGAYVRLTEAIAAGPRLAGFDTPTPEQVRASRWTGAGPGNQDAAGAWSSLLVGTVILYGFGPRILLLGFGLGRRRAARRRFRLDDADAGYARLRPRLMPSARVLGVVDADDESPPEDRAPRAARAPAAAPTGPPAIFGFEMESPATGWPPRVDGVTWQDLGVVDGRDDQQRVLATIAGDGNPPRLVAAVCDLTQTPDRGVEDFLRQVQESVAAPIVLVLTGGEHLRRRGDRDDLEQRVDDWHRLAARLGVEPDHTLEVDLDHLTPASRANLARAVGAEAGVASAPTGSSHLAAAFALVLDHAARWPDEPTMEQRGRLHEAIATLYANEGTTWRSLLGLPTSLTADVAAHLRDGAEHMVRLLPPRLLATKRWLAAGAAAGALGCLAAASLVSPAAIAALPMWSGVGAAVGALLKLHRGEQGAKEGEASPAPARVEAVRAAALFALLLELQGRPEARITHHLDVAIGDDEPPADAPTDALRTWLDRIRDRLASSLATEAAS